MGVIIGVGFVATSVKGSATTETAAQSASEVLYEVEGTQTLASVTYETPTGTSQGDVDLPMRNKAGDLGLKMRMASGSFVYISAQGQKSYGTVTCRITVNGTVISENTSTGYGVVSCKGSA